MFRPFCHTIVVPGTLAAAVQYCWTAPMDCTLQHVEHGAVQRRKRPYQDRHVCR